MSDRTVSIALLLKTQGVAAGVREAKRQIKDFSDTAEAGIKKNRGSLDTLATDFGRVGIAATAGIAIAVKRFADFDAAMSSVKAATHETAGNMAALRDAAMQAGKDTAFSATEAAGAIENLAKAGVSTKDILGGGLKGALDLAAAGGLAVGDAAEIAATAMTQFKLSGKEVPHIADLLAAAAGKAQGEVSDMAMALKQGGLVAAQMGLSIEETTGTLAAFASAGLIGSDAGTSFKTMLLALANPTEKAAGTLERLGIAAYDTKGNFVGIAPLAEQLHAKLSKLTPAQRDSALATIFGSDAIRAANVLYNQGAAGISDWTAKVNDQGYAAETAALKTDNLKGDIERLGGAIDTALIQSGEGANSMLRELVQGADGAVSAFSEMPGWVQKSAFALTGVVAVAGLASAGLIKGVQAAADLRGALQTLGKVSGTLKFSMGAVGFALAAAVTVFGAFAKENAEAKQRVDELRGTLDQATGAITGNTRAYVANQLAQSGLAETAKGFGLSLSTVTDAALGNKAALDSLVGQLNKIAEANEITNSGVQSGVTRYTEQGDAAKELRDKLLGMNGELTQAQKTQKLAAEGAQEHKSAQELQAEAVKKANEAFQAQEQSLEDLISKLHGASSAALELSGSQIAVQAAVDDASEGIKENGRTLDIGTEKGRANRTALNEIAEAANRQTDAMLKSGKSNADAGKAAAAARADFVKVATQMGLNKTQADKLARALIDIPPKADTKVTNNAPAAKSKVDPYATALNLLPKQKTTGVTVTGVQAASAQVGSLAAAIANLKSKTVYVQMVETAIGTGGVGVRRAAGGILPGTPSDKDNMVIGAASGEFVVNSRQTSKHRGLLEAINSGVDGFASGGLVGGGRLVDPAYLVKQLNIPFNPLAGINYAGTLAAMNKANAAVVPARAGAVRAEAAEVAAKNRVAQLQRSIQLQQRYVAELRRQGASEAKIAREQKETIGLQDQLYTAKQKVTAATKASVAADAVYKTKRDAATKATEAHKAALEALAEQQKAAVQLAGQVASGLTGGADLGSLFKGSGDNLVAGLTAQGEGLGKFRGLIDQLRARKLNEDLIGQIIGKGAGQGSVLAQAILDGGLGMVAALNKAQKNLEDQANLIGAGAANAQYGVKVSGARAIGGGTDPFKAYRVGEGGPETLLMGSQPGWVVPNQIDPNRFMTAGPVRSGGMHIDYQRLAQAVAMHGQFVVSIDENRLRGLVRVEAKQLDDRQALEFQTGRR